MKPPTDLEILEKIYNCYYSEFVNFKEGKRITKLYVPIDVDFIGEALGVDGDIIFGRLHYHLNRKYSFRQENNSRVDFFCNSLTVNNRNETHLIRFELMASVLAELLLERSRQRLSNTVAIGSFIVSLIALVISLLN
jgi:hypothetical protein